MGLPALAQLSNTTSTFSGQVAATCSIDLPENIELIYWPDTNYLSGRYDNFYVTANIATVRIHVSRTVILVEPPPIASSITSEVSVHEPFTSEYVSASKTSEGSKEFNLRSTVNPNLFMIHALVQTSGMVGGRFELPPGNYSYRTIISCLQ